MTKKIIIVGASNNPEKYGNKIVKDLVKKGYDIVPVNPNEKEIEGIKTHKILKTVPKDFDIINFVVPPKVTLQILQKYTKLLKNKKIWIQPGAENDEVIKFLHENGFKDYIVNSCIMLEDLKNS